MSRRPRRTMLLGLALACALAASCGARSDVAFTDDGADARTDPASDASADGDVPRDASVACTLRCEATVVGRLPLFGSWADVGRSEGGWLVVQGDEVDTLLHVTRLSEGRLSGRTMDLGVRVEEPRLSWGAASGVGLVVFHEGVLWIDAGGAELSDPIVTGSSVMTRGGRAIALGREFLIWTGDHSAAPMDRGLEAARVPPLAESIAWDPIPEAPARAGITPDFERHPSGIVGAWRVFTGRQLLVSWMDEEANRETTWVVDEPDPHTPGTVDRIGENIAVLHDRVVALRATTRVFDDGRRERLLTVDLVHRDGRIEANVLDTAIDPNAGFRSAETFDDTVVAVHRQSDATFVTPLIGACADGSAPHELAPGLPRFFDATGDHDAVLLTEESEGRGALYEVRCGG